MRSVIILQAEFSANHRCQRRIDCQRGKNAPRPPETDPTAYCGNFTLYGIARDRRGGLKREKPGEDVDADERNECSFPCVRRSGPQLHWCHLEGGERVSAGQLEMRQPFAQTVQGNSCMTIPRTVS
jgi:hypothetical protein